MAEVQSWPLSQIQLWTATNYYAMNQTGINLDRQRVETHDMKPPDTCRHSTLQKQLQCIFASRERLSDKRNFCPFVWKVCLWTEFQTVPSSPSYFVFYNFKCSDFPLSHNCTNGCSIQTECHVLFCGSSNMHITVQYVCVLALTFVFVGWWLCMTALPYPNHEYSCLHYLIFMYTVHSKLRKETGYG